MWANGMQNTYFHLKSISFCFYWFLLNISLMQTMPDVPLHILSMFWAALTLKYYMEKQEAFHYHSHAIYVAPW